MRRSLHEPDEVLAQHDLLISKAGRVLARDSLRPFQAGRFAPIRRAVLPPQRCQAPHSAPVRVGIVAKNGSLMRCACCSSADMIGPATSTTPCRRATPANSRESPDTRRRRFFQPPQQITILARWLAEPYIRKRELSIVRLGDGLCRDWRLATMRVHALSAEIEQVSSVLSS